MTPAARAVAPRSLVLLAIIIGLLLLMPAPGAARDLPPDLDSLTNAQIIENAPAMHPAALYTLAARLLNEGDGIQAARWMYAAQLRYRFLLAVEDGPPFSDEHILFSALHESVGRPINEYIGGNIDEWLAAIDWALEWDETADNLTTSKTGNAEAWARTRQGLVSLRAEIEAARAEIPGIRAENGLDNR